MSKKSGGENGESSNSLTANYNVDLPAQEDRVQTVKAVLLERDFIIKNSFNEWTDSVQHHGTSFFPKNILSQTNKDIERVKDVDYGFEELK